MKKFRVPEDQGLCDFCSAQEVHEVFDAGDFQSFEENLPNGKRVVTHSVGGWNACRECAALINAGEWDKLAERATSSFIALHPEALKVMSHDQIKARAVVTYGRLCQHLKKAN